MLLKTHGKLLFALIEQAVYSLGNLLLTIYIINNFQADEAGELIFVLSLSVFGTAVLGAIFVEPSLIMKRLSAIDYAGVSSKVIAILLVSILLMLLVSYSTILGHVFIPQAVGVVLLTGLFFSLRKCANITEKQSIAALSSCVYCASLIAMIVFFEISKGAVIISIFGSLAMGITAYLLLTIGSWKNSKTKSFLRTLVVEKKTVCISISLAFLYWIPLNGINVVAILGSDQALIAELRKYMNLYMPLLQFNSVFSVYYLSRMRLLSDLQLEKLFYLGGGVNVAYIVGMFFLGKLLYGSIYNGSNGYSTSVMLMLGSVSLVIYFLNKEVARAKYGRKLYDIVKAYSMSLIIILGFCLLPIDITVRMAALYIILCYSSICLLLVYLLHKNSVGANEN